MLKDYQAFCDNPSITTAHNLLAALLANDLDFSAHQELLSIWRYGCRNTHSSVSLNTSGSTSGKPQPYRFGPLPIFWFEKLEAATKYPSRTKPIQINNRAMAGYRGLQGINLSSAHPTEPHISAYLDASSLYRDTINAICDKLDEFDKPTILTANPNVWLCLTSDELFTQCLIKHRAKIELLSTNWEPFYKTKRLREHGVHINDTMINWWNGVNFYTCRWGNQHAYPLFAIDGNRVVNLLNLTGHVGTLDDLLKVRGDKCVCGKLNISVMPHAAVQPKIDGLFIYNLGLVELLRSQYENLQFIQSGDVMDVCYMGEMGEHDRFLIETFLTGSDVRFWKDTLLRVNTKLPAFYRNVAAIPFTTYDPVDCPHGSLFM